MAATVARLSDLLTYEPETGVLRWKVTRRSRVKAGDIAGTVNKAGYIYVNVDGLPQCGHRIAWALTHGEWPDGVIDHINGDPSDNRLCNLRIATHQQNIQNRKVNSNNRSGFKGVSLHKKSGRWVAWITRGGRSVYLGLHDTPEQAHAAYVEAAKKHFGEFARAA